MENVTMIRVSRAIDGNGAQIVKLSGEQLPIPQEPIPNKVIGFQGIVASYVDQTVMEFLQRIRRLFDSSETNMIITTSADQSPEDNADASSRQALAKWLLTAREDGHPKILLCGHYSGGMDGLKGSFVNASKPVNFIIRLRSIAGFYEPFELKNNLWGERLTLRQLNENNRGTGMRMAGDSRFSPSPPPSGSYPTQKGRHY
uniref:Uncharacterized protein n=1 Tax=Globodera rostochiensis TaxID=31243 RepID=A0A914GP06_GLORO